MTKLLKETHELELTTYMSLGNHPPIPCTLEEGNMDDLCFVLPDTPGRKYKITVHVEELDYKCPHENEDNMFYTINCHDCGAWIRDVPPTYRVRS